MSKLVISEEVEPGIHRLTMNRPEARNALSPDLIDALHAALDRLAAQAGIDNTSAGKMKTAVGLRTLILAGAGKCFCAGMDLKGVLNDAKAMSAMLHGLSRFMRRVRRLPVPTIAQVQGAAVGGGCGLMVVTDFAVTHPDAKVGYPEVSLGVCPAVVAPWLMRKVSPGRARALLLEGGTMTGREGHAAGLASHLVGFDELENSTLDLARKLADGGPYAISVTKHWLNELDGSSEDSPFERAAELSAQVIAGEEAQSRLRKLFK